MSSTDTGEKRIPLLPRSPIAAWRSSEVPSRPLSAQGTRPLTQSSAMFHESNLAAQDLKEFEETFGSKELEREGWVRGPVADRCFEGERKITWKV